MNKSNEQKFGLCVFLGIAIGGILGTAMGAANGNLFTGFWIGALAGVAIGWFIAAAILEKTNKEK